MMGSMGGFVTSLNLVQRADVQTDLKLTADQKAQVEKLQEEQRESMRSRFGGGGGAGAGGNRTGGGAGAGGNRTGGGGGAGAGGADVRAQFEALQKAQDEAVNKILTPEQQTRLKQINVQMRGTRVLLDAEFQKELGLDRTQIRTIEDLQEGQQQANAQVFQRVRNGELDNSELQGIVDRNNKILDEELLKVLTEEQKAKLKELQGPEFKRDPKVDEEIRNRGFRPGGN